VKGGHTATSTPGDFLAAAAIGANSDSWDRLPFIFQLPTTSLRRTLVPSVRIGSDRFGRA
jgi:hypothetical protein